MLMKHSRKTHQRIYNSRSVEDNPHYKRIRKMKEINLLKSVLYPVQTYIPVHYSNYEEFERSKLMHDSNARDNAIEHLYVFQNVLTNNSKIIVFEDEDDAILFANLLEADCDDEFPRITNVYTDEIIELCKEYNIGCYLQPTGSMVTPQSLLKII